MMAEAKRAIEEKKAQLGIVNKPVVDDKKATLDALRARVAAKIASSQIQSMMTSQSRVIDPQEAAEQEAVIQRVQSQEDRERSLNLIIDSEGRTIDKRTGEVVQIQSRVPTLKANLKVANKRDYKTAMGGDLFASGIASTMSGLSSVYSGGVASAIAAAAAPAAKAAVAEKEAVDEKFFDPRLKQKTAERNKRKLVFNDKGKYEDIANKLRTKTKLQMLQQEITSISRKTGISAESKLALIQPKRMMVSFVLSFISLLFIKFSKYFGFNLERDHSEY
jgi:U4/U6 small nuclear ribonucleoprotein PRP3